MNDEGRHDATHGDEDEPKYHPREYDEEIDEC